MPKTPNNPLKRTNEIEKINNKTKQKKCHKKIEIIY